MLFPSGDLPAGRYRPYGLIAAGNAQGMMAPYVLQLMISSGDGGILSNRSFDEINFLHVCVRLRVSSERYFGSPLKAKTDVSGRLIFKKPFGKKVIKLPHADAMSLRSCHRQNFYIAHFGLKKSGIATFYRHSITLLGM